MDDEQAQHRVYSDDDFVNCKRYDYSLAKLKERYPDEAPNHVIAAALMISEEEVDQAYEDIVVKLRFAMGVDDSL